MSITISTSAYGMEDEEDSNGYIYITGYNGCDLCGHYDKYYSLIHESGRDLTNGDCIPRSYSDTCIVLCYNCSWIVPKIEERYIERKIDDEDAQTKECLGQIFISGIANIIYGYYANDCYPDSYDLAPVKRSYEKYQWCDFVEHIEYDEGLERTVDFVRKMREVRRTGKMRTRDQYEFDKQLMDKLESGEIFEMYGDD